MVDHSLEPHFPAVVRRENPCNSILMKFTDLIRQDDTAPAAKNADMRSFALLQLIVQISEKFHMAALV